MYNVWKPENNQILYKVNNKSMKTRIYTILFLLFMSVASFLPFPTTTLICLYAAIFRPRWFKKVVDEVYKSKDIY